MSTTLPKLTFEKEAITPIDGRPTRYSINQLTRDIYQNAMSIASTEGGGAHGHLGIVMPDAEYQALTGVAYVAPAHPGALPVHAANATGNQITETNRQYDERLAKHRLYDE